jgi:cation efflux system membrane fusion protein
MKPISMMGSILTVALAVATPNLSLAHVGHGDEFQAEGGVERVQVNSETDSMLGIVASPIDEAAVEGFGVMIPMTALVDADGQQLVFVQYENYYEPVFVTTGVSAGEQIEVTEGLSIGENLVTQGSLSLYAESRKTQTVDVETSPETIPQNNETAVTAVTETTNPDNTDNIALQPTEMTEESGGFPVAILAALGGAVALLVGAFAVLGKGK